MNKVDLARCDSFLRTEFIGRPRAGTNELWDTIDSTNTRAKELISQNGANGAAIGTMIVARQQTAGRGRLGKTWESPPDSGLYVSILLRSENRPLHELSLVTLAAGVAVSKAIAAVAAVELGLKWVNDLICANKKLGGILAETTGAATPYLVLGIGLNINLDTSRLPEELKAKVTSLHEHTTAPVDTNRLLAEICNQMEELWQCLEANDNEAILDEWRRRSITLGRQVSAEVADRKVEGTAEEISDSGALILRTEAGEKLTLTAGEVQIRLLDGSYC